MRASSTIFIAVVLTLSANAAAVEKRAVSTPVGLCISDFNPVSEQLILLKIAMDAFNPAAGSNGTTVIHNNIIELESRITKANTDCSKISAPTNKEEAEAITTRFGRLVPQLTGIFNIFVTKKTEISSVPLAKDRMKTDIKNLAPLTHNLTENLRSKVPIIYLKYYTDMNNYLLRIDDNLNAAMIAYED